MSGPMVHHVFTLRNISTYGLGTFLMLGLTTFGIRVTVRDAEELPCLYASSFDFSIHGVLSLYEFVANKVAQI